MLTPASNADLPPTLNPTAFCKTCDRASRVVIIAHLPERARFFYNTFPLQQPVSFHDFSMEVIKFPEVNGTNFYLLTERLA